MYLSVFFYNDLVANGPSTKTTLSARSVGLWPRLRWFAASDPFSSAIDPDFAWNLITCEKPLAYSFVCGHWPLRPLPWPLLHAKMKQDHALGIAEHYDVSNNFHELFLDRMYMFYTCADFPPGCQRLEEAQQIKADFILDLIDPQPGQKILELGCGWGAMLKRIHEHMGKNENIYGLTLSKEQVEYN